MSTPASRYCPYTTSAASAALSTSARAVPPPHPPRTVLQPRRTADHRALLAEVCHVERDAPLALRVVEDGVHHLEPAHVCVQLVQRRLAQVRHLGARAHATVLVHDCIAAAGEHARGGGLVGGRSRRRARRTPEDRQRIVLARHVEGRLLRDRQHVAARELGCAARAIRHSVPIPVRNVRSPGRTGVGRSGARGHRLRRSRQIAATRHRPGSGRLTLQAKRWTCAAVVDPRGASARRRPWRSAGSIDMS